MRQLLSLRMGMAGWEPRERVIIWGSVVLHLLETAAAGARCLSGIAYVEGDETFSA